MPTITSINGRQYSLDFRRMVDSVMFNSLGFFFLDFLIPFVVIQLNASGAIMGFIFALRTIGYLFSSSFIGFLVDRFPKKFFIALGSIGRGIAYILMYLSIIGKSILGLSFSTTFLGFFAGFFWIPLNALIAEKSHKNNRSKAYGYRTSAQGRGTVIGAIIGFSLLAYAFSIDLSDYIAYAALPIFGIANFYAGYLFVTKVDESDKIYSNNSQINTKNYEKIKNPSNSFIKSSFLFGFIAIIVVMFLGSINGSIARPFLLPYLLDNLTDEPSIATLIYLPSGLVSLFFATKLGEFADRINTYFAIVLGSISGALMTFLLINTKVLIIFAVLLTLDVAIATMTGLVVINLISRISLSHRGKLLSMQQFSENIGNIIGPILGGFLWDIFTPQAPFYLSIVVEILLIPLFLIAVYRLKPILDERY